MCPQRTNHESRIALVDFFKDSCHHYSFSYVPFGYQHTVQSFEDHCPDWDPFTVATDEPTPTPSPVPTMPPTSLPTLLPSGAPSPSPSLAPTSSDTVAVVLGLTITAEHEEDLTLELLKSTLLAFLGPGKLGITEDMIVGFGFNSTAVNKSADGDTMDPTHFSYSFSSQSSTASIKCASHDHCSSGDPFCYDGNCASCDECHYCADGVDNTCGPCDPEVYPLYENPCDASYGGDGDDYDYVFRRRRATGNHQDPVAPRLGGSQSRRLLVSVTVEVTLRASIGALNFVTASELEEAIVTTLATAVDNGNFTAALASECGEQCGTFKVIAVQTEAIRQYP